MMINIGAAVPPVNIAFSRSRRTALIESKMLHYTSLSMKLHHCTMSEIKTQVYTLSDVLVVSQYIARIKNNSQTKTKSFDNTLKTCVDIANEYLQPYKTGAGVKSCGSCSLHQCK